MKRNLLFLLFITLPAAFSHAEPLDSLCEHIGECLDDVTRLEEGRQLLEQAFGRADVEHDRFYPQLLYLQSYYYTNTGDFVRSKQHLLQLLSLLPADCNPELSISVPQDLGLCYRRESQNDSALYYYDLALQAARQQQDTEWLASINLNIGVLYTNLGHHKEAEAYVEQAVEQAHKTNDTFTLLCAQQIAASVKIFLRKYEEARLYAEPAYQLALQSQSPDWQLRCLTSLVAAYDFLQLTDSTALSLQRGDALLPLIPQQGITAIGYLTARGNYYYNHQQWQQAVGDLQALVNNEVAGMKTFDAYDHLARCYEHLGQWRQAYLYKDSATTCATRMAEEQFSSQMAEFNARYQAVEKDLEITRLQARNTRLTIIIISALLLLMVLAAALWLWQHQRRYRREAQLRINTLEQERSRIARELHDGVCNDLLAIEMTCATEPQPQDITQRICQVRQRAREISHRLMPPEFSQLSLATLLQHLANTITSNSNITATFTTTQSTPSLSDSTSHALYRIAQEHTANIIKGGTATTIAITLTEHQLNVSDDGQPMADSPQGIGQRTLRDWALAMNAQLTTTIRDGKNVLRIDF